MDYKLKSRLPFIASSIPTEKKNGRCWTLWISVFYTIKQLVLFDGNTVGILFETFLPEPVWKWVFWYHILGFSTLWRVFLFKPEKALINILKNIIIIFWAWVRIYSNHVLHFHCINQPKNMLSWRKFSWITFLEFSHSPTIFADDFLVNRIIFV